jgi:diacylglycerol kinase (ATP)
VERILLVANASAGGAEQSALDAALEVLRRSCEVEVAGTTTPEELEEICGPSAGRRGGAAGADGTLHAVVNALHRLGVLEKTRLGLVPLGTGNDFARGVGIPLDPAEAAELVAEGRATPIDLVVDDSSSVMVNNAHLGIGAQASRKARRWKPRLGRVGYAVGALSAGVRPQFLRVTVDVDGRRLVENRRVAQVAVGNGPSVGGGTDLVPGAHPTSGYLLVIVSRPRGRWRRLTYLARLKGGSHHLMKEVERASGRVVTVTGQPFRVITDGEISEPVTRRSWTLMPGAVEMLLPAPR